MKYYCFYFLLLTSLVTGIARADEVYKWVDEEGRIHYGDAPADDSALPVEVETRTPVEDPGLRERRRTRDRLLEQFADERRIETEEAARLAAEKAEQERVCERNRQLLWQYEHSAYLYDENEAGERRILNDAERAAEENKVRRFLKANCQ